MRNYLGIKVIIDNIVSLNFFLKKFAFIHKEELYGIL